jgi:hypothetical protein
MSNEKRFWQKTSSIEKYKLFCGRTRCRVYYKRDFLSLRSFQGTYLFRVGIYHLTKNFLYFREYTLIISVPFAIS